MHAMGLPCQVATMSEVISRANSCNALVAIGPAINWCISHGLKYWPIVASFKAAISHYLCVETSAQAAKREWITKYKQDECKFKS